MRSPAARPTDGALVALTSLAVALTATLLPAGAGAQTFTDRTLGTGWNSLVVNGDCSGGCTGSSAALGAGGNSGTNPDPARGFTHELTGGLIYLWHASPFTWDPSKQGPILAATAGVDYLVSSARPGRAIAFLLGVRQGDFVFALNASYDAPLIGTPWRTMSHALPSTHASWCRMTIGAAYGCTAVAPDFTSGGSAVTFGVLTGNSGTVQTLQGRLDDFTVSLTTPVPEPTSLGLLAGGVAALSLVPTLRARRRG